jgi:hypothetical protein
MCGFHFIFYEVELSRNTICGLKLYADCEMAPSLRRYGSKHPFFTGSLSTGIEKFREDCYQSDLPSENGSRAWIP